MSKNGTVKQAALSETLIICDFSFSQSKYSFLYLSILSIISHHILQIVWYYYITVYTNIFKKQVIIIIIVKMFYIALFTKLICPTQVIAFFKYMYVSLPLNVPSGFICSLPPISNLTIGILE